MLIVIEALVNYKTLFQNLFSAPTEDAVDEIINQHPEVFKQDNWAAIGGNESNFGIIENQQSSPIAALVEKVTNSMDAILMRKCYEAGINPKSSAAPNSMEEAINKFFPNQKEWDLPSFRKKQSEEIQVIADGPTRNTSVIIYDNGEGQHPDDFGKTFLSLVSGNKNDIMFVQGKYNMGGSGSIVFCGKKGYQLIGSKKYDSTGDFGFTLVREHPLSVNEQQQKKNTWYEYLKVDGRIPRFVVDEIDLKLFGRNFKTGTILKLYSYQFPVGYSGFAQDLNQSLNEYLFEPVLPLFTIDKKERYPFNKVLELDLFGLKRRLETEDDYVQEKFSEIYYDEMFGEMKVTCYVFNAKMKNKSVKDTKDDLRRRYFKNWMSVMFSMNGQVHGHFTSEFITRTLKFNLLKDYLLINVDCTKMKYDFRKELFMASRDRLKQGDESNELRDYLGKKLRKSQLDEINKRRKESIGLESEDTTELIRSFAKNLPKDSELFKLLQNTLKLEEKKENKKTETEQKPKEKKEEKPFHPQRFPSLFKLHGNKGGINAISLPVNGEKTIKFDTDVQDDYFDRIEEPGELQIALLKIKQNEVAGGDRQGKEKEISAYLNIVKSSPIKGTIKLTLNPTNDLKVGDDLELKISLSSPGEPLNEMLLIKIVQPEEPKEKIPSQEDAPENIGLPELKRVFKKDWDQLEHHGISMNHETVMFPVGEGDKLEKIYINLESNVFLRHRSKLKSEEQITVGQKRYLSSVYFHALFLYMITKRKKYSLMIPKDDRQEEITVDDYIRDVFDSYYSDFLLNFGMEQLIGVLEE
jgi:hypothetical protein